MFLLWFVNSKSNVHSVHCGEGDSGGTPNHVSRCISIYLSIYLSIYIYIYIYHHQPLIFHCWTQSFSISLHDALDGAFIYHHLPANLSISSIHLVSAIFLSLQVIPSIALSIALCAVLSLFSLPFVSFHVSHSYGSTQLLYTLRFKLIRQQKWRWAGHLARRDYNRWTKRLKYWCP